jgi:hypothetical protein
MFRFSVREIFAIEAGHIRINSEEYNGAGIRSTTGRVPGCDKWPAGNEGHEIYSGGRQGDLRAPIRRASTAILTFSKTSECEIAQT